MELSAIQGVSMLGSRQLQNLTDVNMNQSASSQVYTSAILLATFSFMIMLLIIPPMFWHFRNRNIGATVLVAWTITVLLFNFINATVWPDDSISKWYDGQGLCDIEVKVQIASYVALPASFACVLRALAAVLDTERATFLKTKAQRRRTYMLDLSWCIGFPVLQMFFHFIVQPNRYYIFGISGCTPSATGSWLTFLLLVMPPTIWVVIDSHFAVLILIRLYRYRLTFNSILARSSTTKSRFLRLYIICLLWIILAIPVQVYTIYKNAVLNMHAFSWSETHGSATWSEVVMAPSYGSVLFDRWIPLGVGVALFAFFGFGKDAVEMYRSGLLAIGLRKIIPSLRPGRRSSIAATISTINSKAKLLLKRKSSGSDSTFTVDSSISPTTSATGPLSPKMRPTLKTINELSSANEKVSHRDVEKAAHARQRQSAVGRMVALFRLKTAPAKTNPDSLPMTDLSGEHNTVHAAVTAGEPLSPTLQHSRDTSSSEVFVRKEVRQGSEHTVKVPDTS